MKLDCVGLALFYMAPPFYFFLSSLVLVDHRHFDFAALLWETKWLVVVDVLYFATVLVSKWDGDPTNKINLPIAMKS